MRDLHLRGVGPFQRRSGEWCGVPALSVPLLPAVMLLLCSVILLPVRVDGTTDEWKTYTPKSDVRAAVLTGDMLWAATGGGLFSFDTERGLFREYTTSEGLLTIDLTAVVADSSGDIWIGAAGGLLQRYRPALDEWMAVTDISILPASRKRINGFEVWGDSLLILSDVGLSVFSIGRLEFADSYLRFGTGSSELTGEVTGVARYAGRIWISTRFGVASTPATNSNPTDPSTWQVYGLGSGLPSTSVSSLLVAGDSLYAGTSSGIALVRDSSWQTVTGSQGLDVKAMSGLVDGCARLAFVGPDGLGLLDASGIASITDALGEYALSSISAGGYLGTSSHGILIHGLCNEGGPPPGVSGVILPDGPPSAKFVGIAVDEAGWLWSGTGNLNGEGFMSFDGSTWRSYTVADYPELQYDVYYMVSTGPGNRKYVSSWGAGVAIIDGENRIERVLNTTSGLPPTIGDDPFVVVGGVATDRNGVAWVTSRTGRDDTSLVKILPSGELEYVVGCGAGCSMRSPFNVFADVLIDDFGTKWFTNYSRFETSPAIAFYYYNETRNLPGTNQGWGRLTTDDGLTSQQVWSLALDAYGDLWVGSNAGITIIYNPSNPRASIAPYHPLNDQIIQDILVDPMNRKWVATKQGVFLLSQDGTSVLERYTVESTGGKLLENDVTSMALDGNSGVIYFGTEKGLSSLSTDAVTPVRSFGDLSVYPNPFLVPSSGSATIDGLVSGAYIKILTIDGSLVRAMSSPGGRVGRWDGNDDSGEPVPSGVYIVVAYSEDGTEVGSAKIAVIRK